MSTVNRECLAGDPGRLVGDEEPHAVRDVLRSAEPAGRDALDERGLALLAVALPLLDRGGIGQHETRRDRVDRDAERTEFMCHLPGEADLARLGTRVGLDAGEVDAGAGTGWGCDRPAP